eukprot:COSAG06_NODE_6132_length_3093_cov_12.694389_2_plen_283_part_00
MSLAAVLDAATDDTLLAIAIALPTPADLLRLALTCRAAAQRFFFTATSYRSGSAVPSGGTTAATATEQQAETWSIIQEAARQWIAACTEQERGWVPRRGRERWLGLMWEVESLRRRSAVFGRSHRTITLSAGGAVATKGNVWRQSNVASKAVMRAGRHYVQFTVVSGYSIYFGVIRPSWDVEGGEYVHNVDGHCFYHTANGTRYPDCRNWEGKQDARKHGDRIGLLLDLDQGTMTVYKNDERLGVMATDLSGEYSWAVAMYFPRTSARIEAAPAPAAPAADA